MLKTVAPKLFKLTNTLNEDLPSIEQLYQKAQKLGANKELGFQREPGVSFNPRIARITLLAYEAYPQNSIKLSILSCIPGSTESQIQHQDPKELSNEQQAVACAHWLDQLRHMHLQSLSQEEQNALTTKAKQFTDKFPDKFAAFKTKLYKSIERISHT